MRVAASPKLMVRQFESDDEGKTVVTEDGDEIGSVERVSGNKAYVKPMDNLSSSVRQRLDWDEDQDTYELTQSKVAKFDDDEIRIRN